MIWSILCWKIKRITITVCVFGWVTITAYLLCLYILFQCVINNEPEWTEAYCGSYSSYWALRGSFTLNQPGKVYSHVLRFNPWKINRSKVPRKHLALAHCKNVPQDQITFRKAWTGVSGIYKITFLPFISQSLPLLPPVGGRTKGQSWFRSVPQLCWEKIGKEHVYLFWIV